MTTTTILSGLVALLFLPAVLANTPPCAEADTVCWSRKATEYANAYRASQGVTKVLTDGVKGMLDNVVTYAQKLNDTLNYKHEGLAHQSLSAVTAEVGCGRFINAENIALHTGRGHDVARKCVDQWIGSAGHRANLLNTASDEVSVGVFFGRKYDPERDYTFLWVYCVQTFAIRQAAADSATGDACAPLSGSGPAPTPSTSPAPPSPSPSPAPVWDEVVKGWYACWCMEFGNRCSASINSGTGNRCTAGAEASAQPDACKNSCCVTYDYLAPKGQQFPAAAVSLCA